MTNHPTITNAEKSNLAGKLSPNAAVALRQLSVGSLALNTMEDADLENLALVMTPNAEDNLGAKERALVMRLAAYVRGYKELPQPSNREAA